MRKFLSGFLAAFMLCMNFAPIATAAEAPAQKATAVQTAAKPAAAAPAKTGQSIKFAFVLDGPSDKNAELLKTFKEQISKSIQPEYNAVFPDNLIFTGDWSAEGVKAASEKALSSDCTTVISLGALSSKYLDEKKDKKKFVVTLEQYGLRDLGEGFFSPIQQSLNDIIVFQQLSQNKFTKMAILINENFYKNRKDWDELIAKKFASRDLKLDFKVISVGKDINKTLNAINSECDAVFITPLFNLSTDQRKELFAAINARSLPSFSTMGKEDVELGVLYGSGNADLDRKLAQATAFNIQSAMMGNKGKSEKLSFNEEKLFYVNQDTADATGIPLHLRMVNNAVIITTKQPVKLTLAEVLDELASNNLDIERKKLLVKAAKNASLSAKLRYLPTLGMTLGWQRYSEDFAESAKLTTPERTGIFNIGIDQVIYSPALVTNILIQHKKVDFTKQEQYLVEQNLGIETALLYIDTLILENVIKAQQELVKESRENLAIAKTRANFGYSGKEEIMRWSSQLSVSEQNLLEMTAAYKNLKVQMAKLLHRPQNEDISFAPLKSNDPAFFTSEIHVIDYVVTPQNLERFTQMLVEDSIKVAPELAKLRAALKMKGYEKGMFIQRFVLPDAKLSLEYTSLFDRHYTSPVDLPLFVPPPYGTGMQSFTLPPAKPTFGRMGLFAQWKPIEGGHKFAEIARVNNEQKELKKYVEEVELAMEEHVRETINRAFSAYFSIDKNHKAMFASKENYEIVKDKYLKGKAPISQVIDAQQVYINSMLKASNSQYEFFKELVWVQRGLCSINWTKPTKSAQGFIERVRTELKPWNDINLL